MFDVLRRYVSFVCDVLPEVGGTAFCDYDAVLCQVLQTLIFHLAEPVVAILSWSCVSQGHR